jgi:hypothetical protein
MMYGLKKVEMSPDIPAEIIVFMIIFATLFFRGLNIVLADPPLKKSHEIHKSKVPITMNGIE